MKKLICVMLVLVMCLSLLSGCGESSDSKTVKLVWALPLTQQTDYDLVLDKINEKLAEVLPNTTIEFMLDSSMSNKWSLWMAGKTHIDIALSAYSNDLATEINKSSYYPLNDLISKYAPTIKQEWDNYNFLYQTGMSGDELYAIPNVQIHINDEVYLGVQYPEYMDVAAIQQAAKDNPTSTEVFYQIIDNYLNKVTSTPGVIDKNTTVGLIYGVEHFFRNFVKRGYEFVGGNNSLLCYNVSESEKTGKVNVVNFFETPEYLTYIKYASKWYQKGYISKDILTADDGVGNLNSILSSNITNYIELDTDGNDIIDTNDNTETKIAAAPGTGSKISLTPEDQKYNGTSVIGSYKTYLSIPRTSENPERAMQLMEILRTEKGQDLLNTIVYGIEGTHYEKLSTTEIKPFDYEAQASSSSKYGLSNWMCGNMMNMYVCYPYTVSTKDNAIKYFDEIQPKLFKTPVYGMKIDNSKIENELMQMSSVDDEFNLQLIGGVSTDYTTLYNNMMTKLKSAGIDKVISEYQAQVDAFVSK